MAGLAPLIGEVAGVAPASITFEKTGGSLHAEVAGALSMSSDQLVGMDGQEPGVITNAPLSAVAQPAERAADPGLMAHSLACIAAFEFFQGHGIRLDLLGKAETLAASAGEEPPGRLPLLGPQLGRGLLLKWCDRLDEARLHLADRYRHALDRGDEASQPFLLYHFSELECWAGNWDAAEEYALEGCRVAEESHQRAMTPAVMYSLALVRAHRGNVAQARELAGEALALCEQTGNVPLTSQVLSVWGLWRCRSVTTRPHTLTWAASPRRPLPPASGNRAC